MASLGFNTSGQFTVNGNAVKYGQNYIMNGGFDYWNYATSQTTNGYGSDDRWNNSNVGSTKTHSMVNATDTERALFNSSKFSRTVVTSVVGVSNYVDKYQHIENVTKLAGKTITISFWAKADSNKKMSFNTAQVFGTGGAPSSTIFHNAVTVNLTSTWTKFTQTLTIPSIIGKTLGTDGVHTSSTILSFQFDAGATAIVTYFPTSTVGQQSGTFDIAEVKLEEGSVATPWTPYEGEFGGEVQACQRYLPMWSGITTGFAGTTTTAGCPINFKVPARVVPTSVFLPAGGVVGNFVVTSQNAQAPCVSLGINLGINSIGTYSIGVLATVGSAVFTQNTQPGLPVHFFSADNKLLFGGCEL